MLASTGWYAGGFLDSKISEISPRVAIAFLIGTMLPASSIMTAHSGSTWVSVQDIISQCGRESRLKCDFYEDPASRVDAEVPESFKNGQNLQGLRT